MSAIATRYPADRMALLSSEQDSTIAAYYQLSGSDFQTDLSALAADVLDPLDNFQYFFVTGSSHTMLRRRRDALVDMARGANHGRARLGFVRALRIWRRWPSLSPRST